MNARFVDRFAPASSKISQPTLHQLSNFRRFLASGGYKPINKTPNQLSKHLFLQHYLAHIGTFGWREATAISFSIIWLRRRFLYSN